MRFELAKPGGAGLILAPMSRVTSERALWLARQILPHEPALRAWLDRRRVFDLDPDDIVQEAYARLAALESVADIRNPKTYFFQIAHSIVCSHLRRRQVVSIRAVEDVELWRIESREASPESVASDRDELYRIAAILARLPRKVGVVFRLRRIEGLSQKETAARLGVSESTVEKHMGRGIRLFMDALGRGGDSRAEASREPNGRKRRPHVQARNRPRD